LREQFGIEPGSLVDFVAGTDGIRLRKVIDRTKWSAVLGCLKKELCCNNTALSTCTPIVRPLSRLCFVIDLGCKMGADLRTR
jgi:hypothetical protein